MEIGSEEYAAYRAYLRTLKWGAKRIGILQRAKWICERCGKKDKLQVHHKTYDHLFDEPPEDLGALCPACHLESEQKKDDRVTWAERCEAAYETWAENKHGPNWHGLNQDVLRGQFKWWFELKTGREVPDDW
jgi:hypothetical protein